MTDIPKNHQAVLEFVDKAEIVDGVLCFPTLWSLDKKGHFRYWNLFVGIENSETDKYIDVTDEYIVNRKKLPKGYSGAYWTESGVEGTENPIISERKYITEGTNIRSKNYTTPFTQAIINAKSDFNLRIRKGNVLDKEQLNPLGRIVTMEELMNETHRGEKPWRVFAMALHDVNKAKNWRHIIYPCKLQPKLDGTMFIVVYHPDLPELEISVVNETNGKIEKKVKVKMDGYSRGRESYEGQDHILLELYPILIKYPGLHLTGELWKKGYGLQDISGSSRRQLDSKIKSDAIKLDFNIFDCFYIDHPENTFRDRESLMDDIMTELDVYYENKPITRYVKQIPSYEVESKEELLNKYQIFLEESMEGGVIRNLDSFYEMNVDKENRSYQTLKIKPRPDAEWPVLEFKEGIGKEAGVVIWICAENDSGIIQRLNLGEKDEIPPLHERKKFSVTPNIDYETRKKIFDKLQEDDFFEKKIKGQMLTIGYSILSKDFLPQQPKAIRFRDPKINNLILGE